jgi:hypothetical protein
MSLPARSLRNASRRWKSGAGGWSRSGNEVIFRHPFQSCRLICLHRLDPRGGLAWRTVTEAQPKRRMARGGKAGDSDGFGSPG